METYKHSGASGVTGVPLAMLIGCLAAVVLGFVYSYVLNWIPFIYLNFLATLCFGFGLGVAVGWGAKVGKIRNDLVAGAVGLVCGLIGLYVAWAVDPLARFGDDGPGLAFNPEVLSIYVKVFYDEGFWGIGRAGGAASGVFLAIVWLIEAAIIVGGSTIVAASFLSGQPFCEDCNQWTNSEQDVQRLTLDGQDQSALERLLSGDVMALTELIRAEAEEADHLRLDVATCPNCSQSNYLTVTAVRETIDKDGDVSTEEQALVANLAIAELHVELARRAGRPRPAAPPPPEPSPADEPSTEDFNFDT